MKTKHYNRRIKVNLDAETYQIITNICQMTRGSLSEWVRDAVSLKMQTLFLIPSDSLSLKVKPDKPSVTVDSDEVAPIQ